MPRAFLKNKTSGPEESLILSPVSPNQDSFSFPRDGIFSKSTRNPLTCGGQATCLKGPTIRLQESSCSKSASFSDSQASLLPLPSLYKVFMLCGCSVSFHLRHWKLPDSNQLLLLKFLIYLSLTLDSSAIREGVEGDLPSQTTARSPEQPGQVSAVLSPSLEVLGEPTWYWICSFCLMSFHTT